MAREKSSGIAINENVPRLPRYGIFVDSHHHGPEFSIAEHKHPYHSLLYVVSGEGQCLIGGRSHRLFANTAILLKGGQVHQLMDKPGRAMVVFVVYFNEYVAKVHKEVFGVLLRSAKPVLLEAHQAKQVRRSLRQMLNEQDGRAVRFEVAIEQCLASIVLEIYRASVRKDKVSPLMTEGSIERAEKVLEYVADRYYELHSLSEAARMAHLSQRQFANLCRKLTGKSFVEYVNRKRVEKAKELVVGTKMPVSAIAFEVGFEDVSTFYRAFKKYHKAPPLSFRT
jgi:AraC-like DNA-binding protein/mannose-6-phosphate isomerase-like protein (cupin superfamily)